MTADRTRVPLALGLLTLMACTGPGSDAATLEADATTIGSMVDQWIVYWNASDAEGLSSLYVDDAIGMGPGGPNNVGRDAMRLSFAEGFEQFVGTQSATVDEVQVEGALAFVWGSWRITPQTTAGGEQGVDGEWLWILNRQPDGEWRIARHISNESVPQP